MDKIIQVPETLLDYIVAINNGRMLFQKKEIPDSLLGDLETLRQNYNRVLREPLDKKLCLLPIEEMWKYERVPIPEELQPYVISVGIGLTATIDFRLMPPWLWRKLRQFKKAEKELNKKKRGKKEEILKQYYDNLETKER